MLSSLLRLAVGVSPLQSTILSIPEGPVRAVVLADEFIMGSAFNNLSVLDDVDPRRILHCVETMSDDDCRATLHQLVQSLPY